jgi:hypothetical protein
MLYVHDINVLLFSGAFCWILSEIWFPSFRLSIRLLFKIYTSIL